ncbi:MAG: HlyD family type I secretion periplasmic adaptor subunit, partial [Paracoccaceae bacterium]
KANEQLAERKLRIAAQIDGLRAQGDAQQRQLDLVAKELEDQQKLLAKGLAQASRVSSLEREIARLDGRIGNIKAQRAEAAGRIVETEIERLKLETTRREDAITRLRDLRYRELELAQKRIVIKDKLSRLDIRAPVAGSVFGLAVHAVGAVIRPADPLLYIIPRDRPLIIAGRIDPIHIDEVHVAQPVTLRFSTFDQRTTPELFGHIVNLSADSFVDQASGIAYYRAEIVPDESEMEKLANLEVLPGMPVESFIRTEDRTPLSYLVKPMANYFNKAFREN